MNGLSFKDKPDVLGLHQIVLLLISFEELFESSGLLDLEDNVLETVAGNIDLDDILLLVRFSHYSQKYFLKFGQKFKEYNFKRIRYERIRKIKKSYEQLLHGKIYIRGKEKG